MIYFYRLWYIAKTGSNTSKFFTVTVLTLTYIVRTDRFRNCISIGVYSVTRIVLITSMKATICFYRSWYIAKNSLNILKFFTATVLTFAYIVRIDKFRNYISIRAYSVTRIVLIISTEATIYFYHL